MTTRDVFELRRQGRTADAYEAARRLYAADKGPGTSLAMFWAAVDMLRHEVAVGRTHEARLIFMALQRMLPTVPDRDGWVSDAFEKCRRQLETDCKEADATDKTPGHIRMGTWGEDIAAEYLRDKGYVILERDWHAGHRDIDIIARDGECVVFVEVKTRRSHDFGDPAAAVDHRKRRNLRSAISQYLSFRRLDFPYRFDIVTVTGSLNSRHPEIVHMEDVNIVEPRWRR